MLDCGIEISTTTEGKTDTFMARGQWLCEDEECSVSYPQEGDTVTLNFDRSAFRMKRSGESELSCVFRLGERTTMKIGGFGTTGEIPVQTTKYSFRLSAQSCFVTLHYGLIFSEHIQTFQLTLRIDTSEEK